MRVDLSGIVTYIMPVLSMTPVSAKALVASPSLNLYILIGFVSLMIGLQKCYLIVLLLAPNPCALGQQVNALLFIVSYC